MPIAPRTRNADPRTIRTDVQDLRTLEYKTRGVRDWGHADVESQTLFIIEGYLGEPGVERRLVKVAANFADAMEARGHLNPRGCGIFLFTQKPGTHPRESLFDKVEDAVGGSASNDVLITLQGGDSLLIESPVKRDGPNKIAAARSLYSAKASHG